MNARRVIDGIVLELQESKKARAGLRPRSPLRPAPDRILPLVLGALVIGCAPEGPAPDLGEGSSAVLAGRTIRVPLDQPTIAGAMAVAGPGDTVLLAPGVYQETLVLKTGVRVVGGPSVIDATGLEHGITADAGVTCCASAERVTVRNAASQGALFLGATGVKILDSEISGSGAQGIRSKDSDVTIAASRIVDHTGAAGLLIDGGKARLKENVLRNNLGVGTIRIAHGAAVTMENDQVLDGLTAGIELDGGNDPADLVPSRVSIENGVVRGCALHGVLLRDGSVATIEASRIVGNGDGGIRAEGGSVLALKRSLVQENGFAGFGHGVTVIHGSSATIEGNQILGNSNTGVVLAGGDDPADQQRASARLAKNVMRNNAAGLQVINSDAWSREDVLDGNQFGAVLSFGASLSAAEGSMSGNGINGFMASDPNQFFCADPQCTSTVLVQATVHWTLDGMRIKGNAGQGLAVNGGQGSVRRSVISRNGLDGVNVNAAFDVHLPGGGIEQIDVPGVLSIRRSTITENGRWCAQVLGPTVLDLGGAEGGRNSCVGNGLGAVANFTNPGAPVSARGNWWGTADAASIEAMMVGPVDFVPFLASAPR